MSIPPIATTIEASITTSSVIAQLATHESRAGEGEADEFILHEAAHTIALQRQLQDSFSVGRFESEGAYRDFVDIGRVLFVPAGVPLRIRTNGRMTNTLRGIFKSGPFEAIVGTDRPTALARLHNGLNIKSGFIRTLLMQMAQELDAPGAQSVALIEALGHAVQIAMARYVLDSPSHDTPARGGLTRGAYRRLIARIEGDGAAPPLAELAALAGLSERHLGRAFKQSTGVTLSHAIDEARFKRAVHALHSGRASVASVAAQLGYNSPSAFARAFRRWSGQTPRAFLR